MDTKLKSNKKLIKLNIIAIIVLIMTSLSIVSLYPLIKNNIKTEHKNSPYENYELLRKINQTSYTIYKSILEKKSGQELTYEDVYVKSNNDIGTYNEFKRRLNNELEEWNENLSRSLKNLEYSAEVTGIDGNKTNTSNQLGILKDSIANKEFNDKYDFYMVVHYDENGEVELTNIHGADDYIVRNTFSEFNFKRYFDNALIENNEIKFDPIKNATFIYGIPKELKFKDNISVIVNSTSNNANLDALVKIIITIFCLILILGLMIPYRIGKDILGIKAFFKIPFEINCIIFGLGAIFSGMGSFYTVTTTLEGSFGNGLIFFGIYPNLDILLRNILNIFIWIIVIYSIFAGDMLLKHIFNTGLVKYLKENLLIIKLLKSLKRGTNNLIDYVEHIDLSDKSNKAIIKVLLINFVVVSIICVTWFFGILVTFIYSIVLFILIRKYIDRVKNKFSILLNATNKIANGSLDITIDEDLGLFNPIKENIEKIQEGLKKAVNEEVKSQRMKTDLISNVSHDLKTPLTSIITYSDLLKKDNITEEQRKSYIDTIDKKSQRLKFLIEDLFEVSKATSGDIKLNLVNVDLVELMRQTQIELDDKIKKSNLTIKNNFPDNKVVLELDSQKTFRIFENLLINVVKYAMEGSRVYVDITDDKDTVEINIKNMSAEEINFDPFDIVERFQRGDKSRNTEGSGLGLAIAKSFVEVQGGTFKIEVDGDLFKVIITFKK